jgi:sialate O-acetylesterase
MIRSLLFIVSAVIFAPLASLSASDLRFAGIFTDHAVLQRDMEIPVWGWGEPGEKVTVTFASQSKTATADAHGKWMVRLDSMPASSDGLKLLVQSTVKARSVTLSDILVGDVWLCSGQSNMGSTMAECAGKHPPLKSRLEKVNNPLLRLGTVPYSSPAEPLTDVAAAWLPADPKSASGFTAIGYLFGEIIQPEIGVPVGIINASRGSTCIENWTPAKVVENGPENIGYLKKYREALEAYPRAKASYENDLAEFMRFSADKAALQAENTARQLRGEKPLQKPVMPRGPEHTDRPGSLFNGMISPILPYALKGVLWYQGEGNVWDFAIYDQKMLTMIKTWRGLWGQEKLPFFMTELAPFLNEFPPLRQYSPTPRDSARTRFGVALAKGAVDAGNAWTITITDAGKLHDIHPPQKEIAAGRFAARVLAEVYRKQGVSHGPTLKSWRVEGGKAILTFDSAGQGLEARAVALDVHELAADKLLGFELADKERNFSPAHAEVQGTNTVVVSCLEVPEPTAVRYAWSDFPLCNLYNKEGFATYPFRTDDWPWATPK